MQIQSHPSPGGMNRVRRFSDLRPQSPGGAPAEQPPPDPPQKPSSGGKTARQGWLGGHIGLDGGEHVAKSALTYKADAHGTVSDALDAGVQTTRTVGGHVAEVGMSTGMVVATAGLGLASAGLGLLMLRLGAQDVKEGLHHKDGVEVVEGANTMLVGVRSLAASLSLSSHLAPDVQWLAHGGHVAHDVMAPLGIVHGSVDALLGLREVVQGVRQSDASQVGLGVFGMGTGVSLAAAAAGAGVPALVSAGICLAGKVGFSLLHEAQ